ncbi:unnamed protein product [Rhizophagus irregularis]|nr:unnamed protein product [Rhizophagus irregularis]
MNFENLSVVDIQVHVRNTKPEPGSRELRRFFVLNPRLKIQTGKFVIQQLNIFKSFNITFCYGFRPDIIFRYYKDTDDLGIYFIEVTPGVLDISDNALDDLLVSYDHNRKIISIDLDEISRLFHNSDTLKINFVNINPLPMKIQKTTINDIEVEMDTAKKLITILFYNASKNIAKPLSEEEIKFFAEKVGQERMENSKLFLRLKLINVIYLLK